MLLCILVYTLALGVSETLTGACLHSTNLHSYVLLQLLFAEEGLSQWQWYCSTSPGGSYAPCTSQSAEHGQAGQKPQPAAEFEGFAAIAGANGRLYVPAKADEGCVLRVQCTPGSRCVFSDPCTVVVLAGC